MLFCIIRFILIIHIIVQVIIHIIVHFALFNCLVLVHTKNNGVQRVNCSPFPAKPFHCSHHLDIWSWLGRRVSILAPLLCHQILSGMLGVCFCYQHLLWLILDPSPSNAHSYQCWKHMTILRMTIISILFIMVIIRVILINAFEAGCSRVLYEID